MCGEILQSDKVQPRPCELTVLPFLGTFESGYAIDIATDRLLKLLY